MNNMEKLGRVEMEAEDSRMSKMHVRKIYRKKDETWNICSNYSVWQALKKRMIDYEK